MAAEVEDPDKRARWLSGTAIGMLLSFFVGFLSLLSWYLDHKAELTSDGAAGALRSAATMTFATFWLLFPILYFAYIRKSAATLEYQRLVRQGEMELRKRTRGGDDPPLQRTGDR
jgi:hypothetical protein